MADNFIYHRRFVATHNTCPPTSFNTISAGLWFYLYNELATIVVKKTGAVSRPRLLSSCFVL